ncbi:hypothetical protein Pmani_032610 [Petrolisthes manimaculis]|uniref:Tubulin alpha chain n=1 Tax=Petrolisthes manimaculis TaxID=1843537 RepID=A0AAE1NT91_9EUCA|nr:hypothetical protein Pmani_032610 [Petrolisthes manimaculis]
MASGVDARTRQRVVIEFLTAEGTGPLDIQVRLRRVFGDCTVDSATLTRWIKRVWCGVGGVGSDDSEQGQHSKHPHYYYEPLDTFNSAPSTSTSSQQQQQRPFFHQPFSVHTCTDEEGINNGDWTELHHNNNSPSNGPPDLLAGTTTTTTTHNRIIGPQNNGPLHLTNGTTHKMQTSGSSGGGREVLSIHVGQAGVQLGATCWQLFCLEHGIQASDGTKLSDEWREGSLNETLFYETPQGKMVPRTVLADLEPSVVDNVRKEFGDLFQPDSLFTGKEDAATNFARGRYSVGRAALEGVMESVRKQVEACSSLQGFVFTHSFGGGTGSGFMTLLLDKLTREYPGINLMRFCVFPSPRMSTGIVEPYNAILHATTTINYGHCVFVFDNEATYNLCVNKLGISRPTYHHLNARVAQVISSATLSLRIPGSLNVDLADYSTNLVPKRRLHFPVMTYAPVISPDSARHQGNQSVTDMTTDCFNPSSQMATYNPDNGKYMPCCLLYRGDITASEASKATNALTNLSNVHFVEWCPKRYKIGINSSRPCVVTGKLSHDKLPKSICVLANTTAFKDTWVTLGNKFKMMYGKRAFVHWYTGEGLEESEFDDALETLAQLITDYEEAEGEDQQGEEEWEERREGGETGGKKDDREERRQGGETRGRKDRSEEKRQGGETTGRRDEGEERRQGGETTGRRD